MNAEQSPGLPPVDVDPDFDSSRRRFIKLVGGGIILYFTIGDLDLLAQRQGRTLPADFNAYLHVGENGRIACYTGKVEMGQGVITSLAQMLAEELDVPINSVDMVMGDTSLCPWDMGTFGSMTTRFFGPALRKAGAEARLVLMELASEELKVPISRLVTRDGLVLDSADNGRSISYAALAKGKTIERHLNGKVAVKKPSEFTIIGTPVSRQDSQAKVTGNAKYAGDIRLPGMLYARILRPPSHGAKLINVDLTEANKVEGIQIVRDGDFIAALHERPDIAEEAVSKIKAQFEKELLQLNDENIFDHLLKVAPEGKSLIEEGDLQRGEKQSASVVESKYLNDYVAHSPIEPHTAVVNVEGDKVTVWASTQTPFSVKDEVSKELGVSAESVRVMPVFVGGGFGGKTRNIQIAEAAKLSKKCGKPVQVAWSRSEEFFYDSFRPAAIVTIRSGVNGSGNLTLWDYHVYFAGDRGAQQFYRIPNHSTVVHNSSWVGAEGSHPFATGPWRAPGNNTNTFARESQIDIMAAKAGIDPLQFRLRHLTDKKMERVLKKAAEVFQWSSPRAQHGTGRGIACGVDAGTYVASIAEVEVDKGTGNVKVKRVVCAQDMGLSVNPEGAALQMEGCIMMGLGYTLTEQVRFKGKEILDLNYDSYEIPRFSWLPKIETVVIDAKDADPQGGGEPAIVTVGAVVANAVFDAVGVRMFRLPMTPARIKEAIGKG